MGGCVSSQSSASEKRKTNKNGHRLGDVDSNNKNKGIQNDNGKLLKKLEESQRQKNPNYQESSTNNLHVSNHPLGLFAF
nr:2130_t:CDS:2 [Entrophospora candida]CAG8564732.1 2962_t:CDS:2 [Entrophospora candida]